MNDANPEMIFLVLRKQSYPSQPTQIHEIIDDVWINVFFHLNAYDFLVIRRTCKHFQQLTNSSSFARIYNYWELQCRVVCTNIANAIENGFAIEKNQWYTLYRQLIQFFKLHSKSGNHITIDIDKTTKRDPILDACRNDFFLIFKMLICDKDKYKNRDINKRLTWESTPFWSLEYTLLKCCCLRQYKCDKVIQFLLDENKSKELFTNGDKINVIGSASSQYDSLETCLLAACDRRKYEMVKLLLKHPNMTSDGINRISRYSHYNALFTACVQKNKLLVKILIADQRTDVNISSQTTGRTPLMLTVTTFEDDISMLLIQTGRNNFNLLDAKGRTVLEIAKQEGNTKMVNVIKNQIAIQMSTGT